MSLIQECPHFRWLDSRGSLIVFFLILFSETTISYESPVSAESYPIIMFRLEYTLYLCLKMTPLWYVVKVLSCCFFILPHIRTNPCTYTHTHTCTDTQAQYCANTHAHVQRASPGSTIEIEVIALDQQKHNTSAFLEIVQISTNQVIAFILLCCAYMNVVEST